MDLTLTEGHKAMDWLEWSAAIVKALAWPIAAAFIAMLFRGELSNLLGNIRHFKWGDAQVDFSKRLDEVEREVKEVAPIVVDDPDQAPLIDRLADDRFDSLLAISPATAVIDAWMALEQLIDRMYAVLVPEQKGYNSPAMKLAHIDLPKPAFQIYGTLSQLRNEVAHGRLISAVDAYRFRAQVLWLTHLLEERLAEAQVTKAKAGGSTT